MDTYSRTPATEPNDESDEMEGGENPQIEIPVDVLPESKDWKDGQTYNLEMTVKQVGQGKFEILDAEEDTAEEDKAEGQEGAESGEESPA